MHVGQMGQKQAAVRAEQAAGDYEHGREKHA